LTTGRWADR